MTTREQRRRDTTTHELVDAETGAVLAVETCRDTLGGWNNMIGRLEERFGGPMRPVDPFAERIVWTCGEHTFTTRPVNVL